MAVHQIVAEISNGDQQLLVWLKSQVCHCSMETFTVVYVILYHDGDIYCDIVHYMDILMSNHLGSSTEKYRLTLQIKNDFDITVTKSHTILNLSLWYDLLPCTAVTTTVIFPLSVRYFGYRMKFHLKINRVSIRARRRRRLGCKVLQDIPQPTWFFWVDYMSWRLCYISLFRFQRWVNSTVFCG